MAINFSSVEPIKVETNDDVFDEEFRPFRPLSKALSAPNTVSSRGKYRPSPPPHAHNLATPVEDDENNNAFLKNVKNKKKKKKPPTLITQPIATHTKSPNHHLSPSQKWNLIQNKMNDIVPFIQSFNLSPNISSIVSTQKAVHHSDDYSDDTDIDDHPSDDDVLSVNIDNKHKNSMNSSGEERVQSPTLSVLKRLHALKHKHENNRSMSQIFTPNDYDGVINALDVLQSFCRQVPPISPHAHANSSDRDNDHDSDDDVLRTDFDQNIMKEVDPFDTDESENQLDRSYHNNNSQQSAEYDQLPFYNIGNSTVHSATSTRSTHSSFNVSTASLDKKIENMKAKQHAQHNRNHTPMPKKKRFKSPNAKKHRMQLNAMNMDLMAMKMNTKKETISFSDILSIAGANNREHRGNTITPQSQVSSYLNAPGGNGNQKPISPSHSFSKTTEVSMDNADDYEYRAMNDGGGMKRKSHSHSIPGIISKEQKEKMNENVDTILEEDENAEEEEDEIGVLLKKPSITHSQTTSKNLPIRIISPPPPNDERFHRAQSLGVPSPSAFALSNSPKHGQNTSMTSIDSMVAQRSVDAVELSPYVPKKDKRSKSMNKLRESKRNRSRYYTHDVQIERNSGSMQQISVDLAIEENEAEKMGFITRKRSKSRSKTKSMDGSHCTEAKGENKYEDSPRHYTQYAVRTNEQLININNEYNINNGHLVMERRLSAKMNSHRWPKMVVLIALFVCFILGLLVGVGLSWLIFV